MRVLVIGQDEETAEYVGEALRQIWCTVDFCGDDGQGLCGLETVDYDAVILGDDGPELDSMSLLRKARAHGCQLPIIKLFSEKQPAGTEPRTRGRAEERIQALEEGADYCLMLPCDERELLAVLKCVLRRRGELLPDRLSVGDLTLDQVAFMMAGPGGALQLGRREFDVLRILMVNRERVVSKESLLEKVWAENPEAVENNVEVYISFLRKKLETLGVHVRIVTMRRLGYKLTGEPAERPADDAGAE